MEKQNKRLKIAVVGSGISGLTSCYLLSKKHDVFLFEKNDYLGGHTHTHTIYEEKKKYNIDSGFIVYNENTYPNFIKLLNILEVSSQYTSMGFSVKSTSKDFEYAGNSLNSLFAQRLNILKPSFIKMIKDILRFNNLASNDLYNIDNQISLEEYLISKSFNIFFINNYIVPMGAAIWSTSPIDMLKMPALFFIRFFNNHGLLKITNRPKWWVIKNGSKQYVKKIIEPFKNNILLNTKIDSIKRRTDNVELYYNNKKEIFDAVVIATHSDQALNILSDVSKSENNILKNIKYQKNTAILHTDTSILPKRKLAWSSWNYLLNENSKDVVTLTYNMNILQTLKSKKTYCVTLNNYDLIDQKKL